MIVIAEYFSISKKLIKIFYFKTTDDLILGGALLPTFYRLVRYEDLVANPEREMGKLFKFIGVPFTLGMRQFVYRHFHAEKLRMDVR